MTAPESTQQQQALIAKIVALEQELIAVKAQLNAKESLQSRVVSPPHTLDSNSTSSLHTLLLLSDSALPLGSFAFSSGLESYLAHQKLKQATKSVGATGNPSSQLSSFQTFLLLSLQSLGSTALPYVLAAYREPTRIERWDNDIDASTICTVARRASVAQGRALLSVWERSFKIHHVPVNRNRDTPIKKESLPVALQALEHFSASLRNASGPYPSNGHLAPLWGIITCVLSIPLHSSAFLFLFSHVRTVISAAVRASVLGPYQAQHVLASSELRHMIETIVNRSWDRKTEDAGQAVPAIDLWVGRHEMLYSRIFNS